MNGGAFPEGTRRRFFMFFLWPFGSRADRKMCIRDSGKVFRANLKFSRAADDQYHMIREPVRSRQEKSARMPRITASLDCPNHALAPLFCPRFFDGIRFLPLV